MIGAGKYDAVCKTILNATDAEGVVLIIFNGELGNGLSIKGTPKIAFTLPSLLRKLANAIEADLESLKG